MSQSYASIRFQPVKIVSNAEKFVTFAGNETLSYYTY